MRGRSKASPAPTKSWVVDSGSTDRTCEIARRLGARVIVHPWEGYAAQKNFAAGCCTHDWILSLDADEEVSKELSEEVIRLRNAVPQSEPRAQGYDMPRMAQYLGRWILHSGWYPDRKVRLYRRESGTWTGPYVHESLRLSGRAGQLNGNLLHYTCQSLSQHLRTLNRYTSLAAGELRDSGRPVGIGRLTIDPAWTFLRTYFIQRGFLDGPQGLAIAWMAALYTFLKYAKAMLPDEDPASR